jgi:SNF2 family DNA or RNA helicase
MMDCDWNPAVDRQAMSRIWRDGQTRKCHVYRLVTNDSAEQSIFQVSRAGLLVTSLAGGRA